MRKTISFSDYLEVQRIPKNNPKSILKQVDERRLENFGENKDKLTEVKKFKLIENYQQSYSRAHQVDDSMQLAAGSSECNRKALTRRSRATPRT